MKTVYKYMLETCDEQRVTMSTGAELLTVQVQHGVPCIWARVDIDPLVPQVQRLIRMRGTGHQNANGVYVATFQYQFGLVFHVFDGGEW